MSLKFWSNTHFLLAQSELTRAVSVLEVFFFFVLEKTRFLPQRAGHHKNAHFIYFQDVSVIPRRVFSPQFLGITQCKQKPIFNINLSFFLIYFLCGKKGFFFGVMRVLGISGELEKIDKSERLFIPNTGEKNARKEKKIS